MEMAQFIHSVDSYNSINDIDFGETILFIKFGTDWCRPCKEIEQILVDIPNSITYTIDVENDEFEEFLSKNRIYNIPTTIIKYKNNKTQFVGFRTAEQINSMIHNLKTLYPSND
jgi:thiol-disulfide isomerase/thioredoxin|tara:strand:- start:1518 stop:1859 length:342 start_codon:yes stop_codon:yes gene_type:complete